MPCQTITRFVLYLEIDFCDCIPTNYSLTGPRKQVFLSYLFLTAPTEHISDIEERNGDAPETMDAAREDFEYMD